MSDTPEPAPDDRCPECGEHHPPIFGPGGSLDVETLRAMAEQVELPGDVREHLLMAAVGIEALIEAAKEQADHINIMRRLAACLIYETGGAIFVRHDTWHNCPEDIAIDCTEPHDRPGGKNYKVNVRRWYRCARCGDSGLVSFSGRGSDGPDPCPDCGPETGATP